MKRKILSLVLAIALCFAMVLPAYAADYTGITIRYEDTEYTLSTDASDAAITASTTIGTIKDAIAAGKASNLNSIETSAQMLYFGDRLITDTSKTLGEYGIADGATIYLYSKAEGVNVRFEGKDYFVALTDFTVAALKTAIANEGAQGIPNAPDVDKQNLYDNTGNLLTSGSIIAGATVYLYNTDSGKITDVNEGDNQHKKPVTATYYTGAAAATTYSVEITWGSMEFDYKVPDKEWNPETHREEEVAGSGGWTCEEGANKITVKNHSNADVKVAFAFQSNSHYTTGANDGFTQKNGDNVSTVNAIVLASAVGKSVDDAPTVIVALNLSGKLTVDPGNNAIGHVIVTISVP